MEVRGTSVRICSKISGGATSSHGRRLGNTTNLAYLRNCDSLLAIACLGIGLLCAVAGCGSGAITLRIDVVDDSTRDELSSFCLGIADDDVRRGAFGRNYLLGDALPSGFPQTLVVDPGQASSAHAWVRGYRSGRETRRVLQNVSFGNDVELVMATCEPASLETLQERATELAPNDTLFLPTYGRSGLWVAAVAAGQSITLRGADDDLIPIGVDPAPLAEEAPTSGLAVDIDGDCDDDLVILEAGSPPSIWRRDATSFVELPGSVPEGATTVVAAIAGDLDNDGDVDVVAGGVDGVEVWRNDDGAFTIAATLDSSQNASDVTDLALLAVDSDEFLDLVVVRGSVAAAQPTLFLGQANLAFEQQAGVFASAIQGRTAAVGDFNGDGAEDVALAGLAAPVSIFLGDSGALALSEGALPVAGDQDVVDLAAGDVDGDCQTDLVVAFAASDAAVWKSNGDGSFSQGEDLSVVGRRVFVDDVATDGVNDVFVASDEGVRWFGR